MTQAVQPAYRRIPVWVQAIVLLLLIALVMWGFYHLIARPGKGTRTLRADPIKAGSVRYDAYAGLSAQAGEALVYATPGNPDWTFFLSYDISDWFTPEQTELLRIRRAVVNSSYTANSLKITPEQLAVCKALKPWSGLSADECKRLRDGFVAWRDAPYGKKEPQRVALLKIVHQIGQNHRQDVRKYDDDRCKRIATLFTADQISRYRDTARRGP